MKTKSDFELEISMEIEESKKLFDKAVEKFGANLWTNEAWHKKDCAALCPYGDECDKKLYMYESVSLCYGQIYMDTPVTLPKKMKDDILHNMYCFMYSFGNIRCGSDNSIVGGNVIHSL